MAQTKLSMLQAYAEEKKDRQERATRSAVERREAAKKLKAASIVLIKKKVMIASIFIIFSIKDESAFSDYLSPNPAIAAG